MLQESESIADQLTWNGINGTTGASLFQDNTQDLLGRVFETEEDTPHQVDLRRWHKRWSQEHLDTCFGVNPSKLEEAGWGIVWPLDLRPEIRKALQPLVDLRRAQATRLNEHLYRELTYRPRESKRGFLGRHGAGPGPVDPERVPYYLLLVGEPEDIPYSFQYQLDVQYAVGRIAFDTADEYARYAESVVAAETGTAQRQQKMLFFSVANNGDRATERMRKSLVAPLVRGFEKRAVGDGAWELATIDGEAATKAVLAEAIGGSDAPGLVFTASHGMGFEPDDPRQSRHLGALLCRDWPGLDTWQLRIPQEHYFSVDDVSDSASVAGLIAFFFACFGAGSPREDGFERHRSGACRQRAPRSFVAPLPQRLLSHPRGGALAVIGHVDRAWTHAFDSPGTSNNVQAFESTLQRLLAGYPVGAAMEYFGQRYAEMATELSQVLDEAKYGADIDPTVLLHLWTATNDARSYVVVGDPAVRLPGTGNSTSEP